MFQYHFPDWCHSVICVLILIIIIGIHFSTFVCPTEILAFNDRVKEFRALNAEVIACSVDSHFTHLAWTKAPRTVRYIYFLIFFLAYLKYSNIQISNCAFHMKGLCRFTKLNILSSKFTKES